MSGRRSRLSLLAACACGVAAIVVATLAGTVMAILGGELACLAGGGGAVAAAPATRAAVEEIPPDRLRIYQEAGRRIDIDWTFLASIGTQECGQGACHEVNASGCARADADRLRARLGLQPRLGADDLGTLQGRRRRRRRQRLRPRRRDLHRRPHPAPGPRRPAGRRLLRRLPPGRLRLLRRLRGLQSPTTPTK